MCHSIQNASNDSSETQCQVNDEHYPLTVSAVDNSSCFDSIFLLTMGQVGDPYQSSELHENIKPTILSSASIPSYETRCLVKKITNGVSTSSVDPAALPPPKLRMRTRSRTAI